MYCYLLLLLAVVSTSNGWDRIVGGENATIEDFPYQVSIRFWGHWCGGSILSSRIVLTAAHCVDYADDIVSEFTVQYGSADIDEGKTVEIERTDIHEEYDATTLDYDVAIIHLAEDIVFGANAQPIALASKSPAAGSNAVVSGWGLTTEGGNKSDILQKVNVEIVDHSVCKKQHSQSRYQVTDSMLCAGVDGGGKDACKADSGGPLVANNEVVGIVSWGEGCAKPELPGAYADVAYLRQWIDSKINKRF